MYTDPEIKILDAHYVKNLWGALDQAAPAVVTLSYERVYSTNRLSN